MNQIDLSLKPVILIAPLDWGLGHATRCIPIINILISKGCKIIIAASGKVGDLLLDEFPNLEFLPLPGYNIHYSRYKFLMPLTIILQIPKINKAIKNEHQWLKKICEEKKIDMIISDNRYGLYHKHVSSVFITHQLYIQTPFGKLVNKFLQYLNYNYINRFIQCWIPDFKDNIKNLAAELSHPKYFPKIPIHYLGILSRFRFEKNKIEREKILIILSGPEPQRTIFECDLLSQCKNINLPVVLIRGLPGQYNGNSETSMLKIINHLPSSELQREISSASLIISRCGYSTVMDMVSVKKKFILIPTPGQTEQEYLAKHLHKLGMALCYSQKKFNLSVAIKESANFIFHFPDFDQEDLLSDIIERTLTK